MTSSYAGTVVKIARRTVAAVMAAAVLVTPPAFANGTSFGSRAPDIVKPERVSGTIVDVAVSNPAFTTLVAALTAADLVATLQGPGPFTVFAPTNDAFAKVPSPVLNLLLSDPTALTDVLLYHVTGSRQDLRYAFATRDLKTVRARRFTSSANATRCSSTIRGSSDGRS